MAYTLTWQGGTQDFDTEDDAKAAAISMPGIVLMNRAGGGSVTTFREGRELDGQEATEAALEFKSDEAGRED